MSWIERKVFICTICDGEGHDPRGAGLPMGWSGSADEDGICYCPDCRDAVATMMGHVRMIVLDGNPDRVVCTGCGTSFNVLEVSIDGNTKPERCPNCKRRVS